MSDANGFGFGKFVPGFDFLQNLTKGAAGNAPQMPSLSSWIAPTISVEDVEKRIKELKSVQFWLEQNSRALTATIQALEVQKMTLSTLEGMNVSMKDVANAFKLNTSDSVMGSMQKMSESFVGAAQSMASTAKPAPVADTPTPPPAVPPEVVPSSEAKAPTSTVDPMQWWSALTQQFKQIAGTVLADVAKQASFDASQSAAKDALKTATTMASEMATKGVKNVQEVTRAVASKMPLPMSPPMPVRAAAPVTASAAAAKPVPAKKITAAKNTTAAKDTTAAKKPVATKKAAAPKVVAPKTAAAAKTTARRPAAR